MIRLFDRTAINRSVREIDAMFRSRAETFSGRLGWEVVVKDGYERDRFDELNPLYVISVDPDSGEYWGSLRLLPTTGPNMLRDVFPQLLGEDEQVAHATIWESSRICVANCAMNRHASATCAPRRQRFETPSVAIAHANPNSTTRYRPVRSTG